MFDNHSSDNNGPAPQVDNGGLIPVIRNENGEPTISSIQIAELVEARHDKVKQCIERLAKRGTISLPPMGEVKIQRERREETVGVYLLEKRDSFVVVAQLSPEFTARLVDRWQELEAQLARQANPGGLKPLREQSRDEILESFGVLVRVAEEERRIALAQTERGDMYESGYRLQTDNPVLQKPGRPWRCVWQNSLP